LVRNSTGLNNGAFANNHKFEKERVYKYCWIIKVLPFNIECY